MNSKIIKFGKWLVFIGVIVACLLVGAFLAVKGVKVNVLKELSDNGNRYRLVVYRTFPTGLYNLEIEISHKKQANSILIARGLDIFEDAEKVVGEFKIVGNKLVIGLDNCEWSQIKTMQIEAK